MTPKEKASELIKKFEELDNEYALHNPFACALICVDEILTAQETVYEWTEDDLNGQKFNDFWKQVKVEINNF